MRGICIGAVAGTLGLIGFAGFMVAESLDLNPNASPAVVNSFADDADIKCFPRVYNVDDLLARGDQAVSDPNGEPTAAALIDLLTRIASPTSWDAVGGPGSIKAAAGRPARLIVSQSADVHQLLASALNTLRSDLPEPPLSPAEQRLSAMLEHRATYEIENASFSEAIDALVRSLPPQLRLPIVEDERGIEESDYSDRPREKLKLHDVRFQSALQLVLRQRDLVWLSKEDERGQPIILITARGMGCPYEFFRIYNVTDLVRGARLDVQPDVAVARLKALKQVITQIVAPTTWEEVGGPAEVIPYVGRDCRLAIYQDISPHEEIRKLFAELRGCPYQPLPGPRAGGAIKGDGYLVPYDVTDLTASGEEDEQLARLEQLAKRLKNLASEEEWQPGGIEPLVLDRRWIVVSQTMRVHERVVKALAAARAR